ncbi:MAG TPA: DUF4114 domain-containing protein, partial [Polyangiaceae bacterium]|nr:DUF4114 domain-containing protein [Polyangiaceae bacterium]
GTLIPVITASVTTCSDKNVQACLNLAEGSAGLVNAISDAKVTPDRYTPFCSLTFTVVARGSGYKNVFGWYNVIVDPVDPSKTLKPAVTDLHSFLLNTDAVGTQRSLDLRNDPAYGGGEVGFFIATGRRVSGTLGTAPKSYTYLFYSERQFNPDNQTTGASWIHLLIYQSVTYENSFYFAWEDLLTGGDNDFDDLLTRVDGIQCTGSGAACDTGLPGICTEGTEQCRKGSLECVGTEQPRTEQCNALDDDCNGSIDEGDLCPPGQVCDRGQCVNACGEVVNTCKPEQVCDSAGFCVDQGCLDVDCPSGQICSAGECRAACDGVTCPLGQTCLSGRCSDPCTTVTCDPGDVCELGVCKASCDCTGCSGGLACDSASGLCTSAACVGVSCTPGTNCISGTCIDNCAPAVCPSGDKCSASQCIEACSDVTCDAGLKCAVGVCVDACVGVICGPGLKCVAGDKNLGECVDGCLGVDCGPSKECKFGSCGTDCVGVTCPEGETCNAGSCSNLCSTLMCPSGEVCRGGACEDACSGVTCPEGQLCDSGLCVTDPDYLNNLLDGGTSGAGGDDAGAAAAAAGNSATSRKPPADQSGACACRVGARGHGTAFALLGLVGLALLGWRRRKRS